MILKEAIEEQRERDAKAVKAFARQSGGAQGV